MGEISEEHRRERERRRGVRAESMETARQHHKTSMGINRGVRAGDFIDREN